MNTIFALICLFSPALFFGLKASITYGQDINDILDRWKSAKIVAFCLYILYAIFIAIVGHEEVAGYRTDLEDWADYYILPGIAFSLIVLSRPASEILKNYTTFFKANLEEDAAFMIGWAMLLGSGFLILIEWL